MKKRLLALLTVLALACALAAPAAAFDMGKAGERSIISAGDNHSAAIDTNGALWMWGSNGGGALGDGTNTVRDTQVKVMDSVASVSCGGYYTAAIRTDGTLWMWGDNDYGQLGDGTTTNRHTPVKIMDNVAVVSCGISHTAAIRTDGTLWMWGNNLYGELGNGRRGNAKDRYNPNCPNQTVPVKVLDNVAAVSCGSSHTAAIRTDGTLWMWGLNVYGELSNGGGGNAEDPIFGHPIQTVPVKVLDNVTAVSCGYGHTAAIRTDGTLWMWGFNDWGGLGDGTETSRYTPVKVLDNVAAVSCGPYCTAAIRTDGILWMWGWNRDGQLGDGTTTFRFAPVKVLDNVAAVSCGGVYTAAVRTDGTLWMWGANNGGQLGNGGGGNAKNRDGNPIQTVPVQITLGGGASLPRGVRLSLNGGTGCKTLWTDASWTIRVPTNPTKPGCNFGGWYTDAACTKPWNFNDRVSGALTLYARWIPISSSSPTTGKSSQIIWLDGKTVTLDAYTLKADSNGGDVTYVKLRDIAALLEDTNAKFNVDWRQGAIYVSSKKPYTTQNGTELKTIDSDGSYRWNQAPVLFDGVTGPLEGIVLTDRKGGDHTFFKLRDLGEALDFNVGWEAGKGIYIETE